jgi:hypothetical protein
VRGAAQAIPAGWEAEEQATAKAKCGGLSTAAAKCACPFDCAQGRDDVLFRLGGKEQTTATAEADTYGMTNKRTGNRNGSSNATIAATATANCRSFDFVIPLQ